MAMSKSKADRNFSIGELLAYTTVWAIALGMVSVAPEHDPKNILGGAAVFLFIVLGCFTVLFIIGGRKQLLPRTAVALLAIFAILAIFDQLGH